MEGLLGFSLLWQVWNSWLWFSRALFHKRLVVTVMPLGSPCLISAFMPSYSHSSHEFSWMANSLKQQTWVKKHSFFWVILQTDQIPVSVYNAAPQAFKLAEQQRDGHSRRHSQRRGKRAAKAPLHSAGPLPLNDCDHVTQLMSSDPTATTFIASRWAHSNSTRYKIWRGTRGKSHTR